MDIDGTVIWLVGVVGIVFGGVEVSCLGVEAAHLAEGRNPRIPFDLGPAEGEVQRERESRGRRGREEQTSGEWDEADAVWVCVYGFSPYQYNTCSFYVMMWHEVEEKILK